MRSKRACQRREVCGHHRTGRNIKYKLGEFLSDPGHGVGMAQDDRCLHAVEAAIKPVARSYDSDEFSVRATGCVCDEQLGMRTRCVEMDSGSSSQVLIRSDAMIDRDRCFQICGSIAFVAVRAPKNIDHNSAFGRAFKFVLQLSKRIFSQES